MKKIVTLLIAVFLITSCENDNQEKYESLELVADYSVNADSGFFNFSTNSDGTYDKVGREIIESDKVKQEVERKLIKNGRITFETEDLNRTKNQIVVALKKYKGYISSENQNEQYDRINTHLKVRVPFKKFDSLLLGISKEIEKFDHKEIKISDVTEDFLDIQTRLKNKKELEKKYLDILKKAKTVKEILEVEKEIGSLREDIESAEGKLKYLSDQVSFSTLDISFYKKISNESSFSRKLKNALKDGYESIKSFFIYIISNWPLAILILILFIWFKRRNKKK